MAKRVNRLPSWEKIKGFLSDSPSNFRLLYQVMKSEKKPSKKPLPSSSFVSRRRYETSNSDMDAHIQSLLCFASSRHLSKDSGKLRSTLSQLNESLRLYGGTGKTLALRRDTQGLLLYFQSAYAQEDKAIEGEAIRAPRPAPGVFASSVSTAEACGASWASKSSAPWKS